MTKEFQPIPENTTLELTRAQWLAVKGVLESYESEENTPFLSHYACEVLEQMGGYNSLAFGNFQKHDEYNNFYKNFERCAFCNERFFKEKLTKFIEDQEEYLICNECLEENTFK